MSMNDAECQTNARKFGGVVGAIIFVALWQLGSNSVGAAFVAGVASALIVARTTCYVMGCLPKKTEMTSAEPVAKAAPAAKPAAPAPAPKPAPQPAPAPAAA
ncbi:hypothetical protein, partial [Rhodobacter sp. TJ_12]|uniref:hypothetical protein n=1 Tax=Rhodobacter sp. TJ_12 TaxID=2029399 RepID=UPI001CBBF160